jgi:SAM-dependent methyltransferase
MSALPMEIERELRISAMRSSSHSAPIQTAAREPASYSLPQTNALVLKLLAPHLLNAERVLDIGAGEGYLARRVQEYIDEHDSAADLEACDLFPENFRVPEVECRGIDLHGGLPFPDQSVDLAYSVEVLEHLEDQFAFLREVHRVLRPGGRFVLTTPNVLNLTSRLRTLLVGFPELFGPLPLRAADPQHLGGHIHPVSVYYISYMAEKAGFCVSSCYIDRVKSSSVVALMLWPLIALASRYARIGMRRRSPVATAENQAHLELMNTLRVLTGRTIVLELVRR